MTYVLLQICKLLSLKKSKAGFLPFILRKNLFKFRVKYNILGPEYGLSELYIRLEGF